MSQTLVKVPSLKSLKLASATLFIALTLSACVTVLVATAVITTIDILHDRRTVGEYIDDGAIEVKTRNVLIANAEFRKAAHVKTQSWNGILLLTGEIDDLSLIHI